jgi:putative ABC transport system permease protein
VGANPDFIKLSGMRIASGRFLADSDLADRALVAVLGCEAANVLFPDGNPIGQRIRMGEQGEYQVVGVTSYKAPSAGIGGSLSAENFNRDVFVSLTTEYPPPGEKTTSAQPRTDPAEDIDLSQITLTVNSPENVKSTAKAVESLLLSFHPAQDFTIVVPLELVKQAEATDKSFNLVLGSIASISLLVGGLGIMSIMLATVTERTREIGIRRALGARRRDIIEQFLVEATVISSLGGFVGVLLGLAAPHVVSQISGMPVLFRPWTTVLAFLIAVAIGVLFGIYPARRAAMLDPVEAIRGH